MTARVPGGREVAVKRRLGKRRTDPTYSSLAGVSLVGVDGVRHDRARATGGGVRDVRPGGGGDGAAQ